MQKISIEISYGRRSIYKYLDKGSMNSLYIKESTEFEVLIIIKNLKTQRLRIMME